MTRALATFNDVIDLHTHSNFSDGSCSPRALAELAHHIGLRTIALTDHDTTASHAEMATACADYGIELITGTEISLVDTEQQRITASGESRGTGVHVLAYFLPTDPDSPMQQFLTRLRTDRDARNRRLVAMLQEAGFERITIEYLFAQVANPDGLGRPHIAEAMFALHPEIMGERTPEAWSGVFTEWLGTSGRAYIPKTDLTIEDAVAAAAGSGTVFSVAHPLLNYVPDSAVGTIDQHMPRILHSLKDRGFSGVEAYYGSTNATTRAHMVKITRDAGMIPTGGSDFHGTFKPDVALGLGRSGDLHVPDHIVDELREASSR